MKSKSSTSTAASNLAQKPTAAVEAIKAHPLYPVLELLATKCEKALLLGVDSEERDSLFKIDDVKEMILALKQKHGDSIPRSTDHRPEVDELVQLTIVELRKHLGELEKLWQLCDHFHQRYIDLFKSLPSLHSCNSKRRRSSPYSSVATVPSPHSSPPSLSNMAEEAATDPEIEANECESAPDLVESARQTAVTAGMLGSPQLGLLQYWSMMTSALIQLNGAVRGPGRAIGEGQLRQCVSPRNPSVPPPEAGGQKKG